MPLNREDLARANGGSLVLRWEGRLRGGPPFDSPDRRKQRYSSGLFASLFGEAPGREAWNLLPARILGHPGSPCMASIVAQIGRNQSGRRRVLEVFELRGSM